MGGADRHNVTLKIINALKKTNISDIEVTVVAGASNLNIDKLKKAVSSSLSTMNIIDNVKDMADLMARVDMAVSAGGSTCWELSFMKLPFFSIILANNQREISIGVAKAGIAINCGWYYEMDSVSFANRFIKLINDRHRRSKMSEKAGELIDGAGANRIIKAMLVKP
jgi:spore coat polysaccharide biosynthesis predicted glycosyltransferase SpsG